MSQFQVVPCPHCGAGYQLTADYLAQYGGQQSQCHQCGNAFPIPRLGEAAIPVIPVASAVAPAAYAGSGGANVLPYMGPNYQDPGTGGVWRDGDKIVAMNGAVFPPRCVKCNAPADGQPFKRKLYWHHPLVYLALLANILIYAIIAMSIRKTGTVTVSMCQRHIVRRRWFIFAGWMSVPVAIAMFIVAGNTRTDAVQAVSIIMGIITLIGGILVGVIGARVVAPTRIDDRYLWLKGAGAEFRATLSPAR